MHGRQLVAPVQAGEKVGPSILKRVTSASTATTSGVEAKNQVAGSIISRRSLLTHLSAGENVSLLEAFQKPKLPACILPDGAFLACHRLSEGTAMQPAGLAQHYSHYR